MFELYIHSAWLTVLVAGTFWLNDMRASMGEYLAEIPMEKSLYWSTNNKFPQTHTADDKLPLHIHRYRPSVWKSNRQIDNTNLKNSMQNQWANNNYCQFNTLIKYQTHNTTESSYDFKIKKICYQKYKFLPPFGLAAISILVQGNKLLV